MLGRPLTVSVSSKVSIFFCMPILVKRAFRGNLWSFANQHHPMGKGNRSLGRSEWKVYPGTSGDLHSIGCGCETSRLQDVRWAQQSRYSWAWVFFFWGANGWLENRESLEDLRYSRGNRVWILTIFQLEVLVSLARWSFGGCSTFREVRCNFSG